MQMKSGLEVPEIVKGKGRGGGHRAGGDSFPPRQGKDGDASR